MHYHFISSLALSRVNLHKYHLRYAKYTRPPGLYFSLLTLKLTLNHIVSEGTECIKILNCDIHILVIVLMMRGKKLAYYKNIKTVIYLKSITLKFKHLFKHNLYQDTHLMNGILLIKCKFYGIITCKNLH